MRLAAAQEIAAGEIGGRQVVMTGHGDKRDAESRRHMGDEAGLAASGRALKYERQAMAESVLEQRALLSDGEIERNFGVGFQRGERHGLTL